MRLSRALAAGGRAEEAATFDCWSSVPDEAAQALGLVRERVGDLLVVGTGALPEAAPLNRVMGAGRGTADAGALAAAVSLLHARGCVCQVALRDDAPGTPETRAWLARRGFTDGGAWMRFLLPAGTPPPAAREGSVRVRPCGPGDAAIFGETFAAGFGLPPALSVLAASVVGRHGWRCFLAETDDGTPAGTGALFVHEGAGWLGMGATRPDLRGRGAQGALLRERIAEARALGCRVVTVETGERAPGRPSGSYRNILRAGFREAALRPNLIAPPPPGRGPAAT